MTVLADKLALKEVVAKNIGPQYAIPVLDKGSNASEFSVDSENFAPFVLKTNHDSGGTVFIDTAQGLNLRYIRAKLSEKLQNNFYLGNREWEYKNIHPKWFTEPVLKDDSGNIRLSDFKVHCFNGCPLLIQTIFDRAVAVKENWFDFQWNPFDFYYFSKNKACVKKPLCLEEMHDLAASMSRPFSYARVDFYVIEGRPLIGEVTFRPFGGFMKWSPDLADFALGERLMLGNAEELQSNLYFVDRLARLKSG